jgi:dihydroorotase (multifunctional complex type)
LPVDAVLVNAKVFTNGNLVEAGLAIDNGKIVKIAKTANLPDASTKFDLNGYVVLPGLIDVHVHLRDQQLAYKEDFMTGTSAAAAGGVTTVIDMPNNKPVTMDCSSLRERIMLAQKQVLVNVGFNSALPKHVTEIGEIVKAGAVGFKVYLSNRIGGLDIDDDALLSAAFHEASACGVPVAVHAEDHNILEAARQELETSNQTNTQAYTQAHPPQAEAKSIQRVIRLVKTTGARIHFCHLSSALGLQAIAVAKKEGLPVTCEVTPHNLLLTSETYHKSGFFALTDPPLRTQQDITALWDGLKQGLIDAVATDHAPHTFEEKNVHSVWDAKPGVPGLETILPLLLTQVNSARLSLGELVKLTAEMPAKIFNLTKRGSLDVGNWADCVVVDPKFGYVIDSFDFFSKAKYSPFDGMRVKGKPVKTFVSGNLVMDEGVIVGKSGVGCVVGSGFVGE